MHEDEIPVGRATDLRGKKYNRLTALYRTIGPNKGKVYWKCECECGNILTVERSNLVSGQTQSCGCLHKEITQKHLEGQRFNRLLVVKDSGKRDAERQILWECKCECGNTILVPTRRLTYGTTKSCGCLRQETISKNLIGQRFGKLVVIKDSGKRVQDSGNIIWQCKCDCGNVIDINGSHLTKENGTKSCGCITSAIDLTNQRFGKLVAIRPTEKRMGSFIVWECKCDCGNTTYVASGNLNKINGTQSCGCINSIGEKTIGEILRSANIPYELQKTFNTCRFYGTKALAKFDFFINQTYLIEYDGVQHYDTFNSWYSDERKEKDEYKNQWCKENNIPLIRIPYTKLNTLCIEDLMLETTQFRVV